MDEKFFQTHYENFSAAEKELHGIVRAYTQYSLRPMNQAIAAWLEKDSQYKTQSVPCRNAAALAETPFIDLRNVRQEQNPAAVWLLICRPRSFVLLQELRSCINGHSFQAGAETTV